MAYRSSSNSVKKAKPTEFNNKLSKEMVDNNQRHPNHHKKHAQRNFGSNTVTITARRLSGNQDIIGDDDLCVAVDGIRQPVPGQRPSVRLQNVPPTMRGPDDKHGHCEVWLRQRQLAEQLALFVLLEVRPLGLGQNPTIVYVVEGFVVEPMINVTHLVDRRSADEVQREEQHVDLHEEIKDDAREDADRDSVKHAVEPLRGAHRRHHRGAINVLRQVDALGPRQGLLLARDKSAQQPGGAVALLAAHRRTGSHRSLA
eukprot:CAMPEP_0170318134 /NCGR_PEP_ID=MMETSP0116_2-20130129/59754_1 /TAXON_ID=400756 /ORGANISM="Durinskia baltica, Strain CSIRO CS-38" /LENGTH=256 /DNA_ID=CAMNT_0010570811 /DNA_START=437 /DNA_END=1207 /DNA_ORIENTATION=-